ncbi:hypothetical protein [Streptosporangium canum]
MDGSAAAPHLAPDRPGLMPITGKGSASHWHDHTTGAPAMRALIAYDR